jgi:hypothetical protein
MDAVWKAVVNTLYSAVPYAYVNRPNGVRAVNRGEATGDTQLDIGFVYLFISFDFVKVRVFKRCGV